MTTVQSLLSFALVSLALACSTAPEKSDERAPAPEQDAAAPDMLPSDDTVAQDALFGVEPGKEAASGVTASSEEEAALYSGFTAWGCGFSTDNATYTWGAANGYINTPYANAAVAGTTIYGTTFFAGITDMRPYTGNVEAYTRAVRARNYYCDVLLPKIGIHCTNKTNACYAW